MFKVRSQIWLLSVWSRPDSVVSSFQPNKLENQALVMINELKTIP
jgi:hypothetical protein